MGPEAFSSEPGNPALTFPQGSLGQSVKSVDRWVGGGWRCGRNMESSRLTAYLYVCLCNRHVVHLCLCLSVSSSHAQREDFCHRGHMPAATRRQLLNKRHTSNSIDEADQEAANIRTWREESNTLEEFLAQQGVDARERQMHMQQQQQSSSSASSSSSSSSSSRGGGKSSSGRRPPSPYCAPLAEGDEDEEDFDDRTDSELQAMSAYAAVAAGDNDDDGRRSGRSDGGGGRFAASGLVCACRFPGDRCRACCYDSAAAEASCGDSGGSAFEPHEGHARSLSSSSSASFSSASSASSASSSGGMMMMMGGGPGGGDDSYDLTDMWA